MIGVDAAGARDRAKKVRCEVAARGVGAEVLALLAEDPKSEARRAVAHNEQTLVSGGREPPLYLVERLWRGSVGAGCSPRRVGLYPPVT